MKTEVDEMVREQIRKFIVDNFLFGDEGTFKDDDSFLENGIIDSTGILELVAFLEESAGVKVEDSELLPENLDSVNRIVAFTEKKKASLAGCC